MTTQITEHFTRECLEYSATAQAHGIDNTIPDDLYYKAQRLCSEMEDVRSLLSEHYGEDTPVYTNSGYRCPELNTLDKGQPTSQHMALEAMDFHTSHTPEDDWNIIKDSNLPYDQLILEHDAEGHIWCHYSVSKENAGPRHMAFTLAKG